MTDASPGPGWWLASDGKWYPPHLHPDARLRTPQLVGAGAPAGWDDPTGYAASPSEGVYADGGTPDDGHAPAASSPDAATTWTPAVAEIPAWIPTEAIPPREPIDWERVAAERAARRRASESRRRKRVVGATLSSVGALGLLFAIARNTGGNDDRRATPSTEPATTAPPTTDTVAPSTTAAPVTASTIPGEASVSVFTLQPGTCINNADLASGLVTNLASVPCDSPHSHEVYYKVTYTPPDGAYDTDRISAFANEQCSQGFANYVGVPYTSSKYYYVQLAPSADSWTQKGDRDIVCLLFLQGAQVTGSAKGTAQ